jgi:hypothetical protein
MDLSELCILLQHLRSRYGLCRSAGRSSSSLDTSLKGHPNPRPCDQDPRSADYDQWRQDHWSHRNHGALPCLNPSGSPAN